jgi:glycosyltransferase involved in cell wall biosynthesis
MLTVLFSTYNGARTLPQVLAAYCNLLPPPGGWQLVIVDNGSTDLSGEILTSFKGRLPLSCVFEPKPGKNAALNSGLSKVTGDLVVLTDDDVIPSHDWLCQLRCTADLQASFSVFGGPILPMWEMLPQKWILDWVPLSPTFALVDSRDEGPIRPRHVYGPNMAVRAEFFRDGYRFDETIGPNRMNYAMGSESQLTRRLERDGHQGWFCKNAVVQHIIRPFQLEEEWILKRAVRFGRGQFRLDSMEAERNTVLRMRELLYYFRQLARITWKVARAKRSGNPEKMFKARWERNFLAGKTREAFRVCAGRSRS